MKNFKQIGNAPKTNAVLVKECKEMVNSRNKPGKQIKKEPVICGLSNPCSFGKHNSNFDKNNILNK